MSIEKPRKSSPSDDNSSSISNENSGSGDASTDKKIQLNDFLEFLNISCHLNDMITNNNTQEKVVPSGNNKRKLKGARTAIVDFKKLADNSLVNDLYDHKKSLVPCKELLLNDTDSTAIDCNTNNGNRSENCLKLRNKDGFGKSFVNYFRRKSILSELAKPAGLHPKLNQKLDYVINEGVLDSVLPFICPVPLPPSLANRMKVRQPKSIGDANSNVDNEKNTAASIDNTDNVIKLKNVARKPNKLMERKEPEVVIHVCDEVKNTSKDFTCPQNLLIDKMGYFADVTAGQKLEDMDISVHCDIHIFDWLMRWVKHSSAVEQRTVTNASACNEPEPLLDANNVVPIMVSASFLQMEPLLLDCLSFCHSRLAEVVRCSANLACLNDALVARLAAMFTNLELEAIRDKKDRVTPRLWIKLIQSLCEPEPEALRGHYYSLVGLFRCAKCNKCLTNTCKIYVNCVHTNMRLNRWGQLVSHHVRDTNFDVNDYISQLFKELRSWRKVYWKLWGHCHFLYCFVCETHFPVHQLNWCRYHPESPNFLGPTTEGRTAGPAGRYPCCGQQAFRFETLTGPSGCQFREHSIMAETDRERAVVNILHALSENNTLGEAHPPKLSDIANNGEDNPCWIGLAIAPTRGRCGLLPILNPEDVHYRIVRRFGQCGKEADSSSNTDSSDSEESIRRVKKSFGVATLSRKYSSSSDGCESDSCSGITKPTASKKSKKKSPKQPEIPGRYWSGELSARSNQDHQREFEERVMKQVIAIINKRAGSEHGLSQNSAHPGGTYMRLEAEWKDQLKNRNNNQPNSSTTTVNTTSKAKNKA